MAHRLRLDPKRFLVNYSKLAPWFVDIPLTFCVVEFHQTSYHTATHPLFFPPVVLCPYSPKLTHLTAQPPSIRRSAQSRAKRQENHRLRSSKIIEGIKKNLQMPREIVFKPAQQVFHLVQLCWIKG